MGEMPMIGEAAPGLWHCIGFGGHGVVPTCALGDVVARGILNEEGDEMKDEWKLFSKQFPLKYAGWPIGKLLGQLYYWKLQLTDSYNFWKQGDDYSLGLNPSGRK